MDTEHEDTTGEGRSDTPARAGDLAEEVHRRHRGRRRGDRPRSDRRRAGCAQGAGDAEGACEQPRPRVRGARADEGEDPHDGRLEPGRRRDPDQGRPDRRGRQQGRPHPKTRSINLKGRTVVPGIIDNHNHIVLMGNRPGLPHAARERLLDRRRPGDLSPRAPRGIPRGAWITTIGGFHRNHCSPTSCALPTLRGARRGGAEQPGRTSRSRFSGPSATNSLGKAFFEAARPAGPGRRRRLDRGRAATGRPAARRSRCARRCSTRAAPARRASTRWLRPRASASPRTSTRARSRRPTRPPTARRTRTTTRCTCRSSSCTADGRLPARLRINFLHMETDPALPDAAASGCRTRSRSSATTW